MSGLKPPAEGRYAYQGDQTRQRRVCQGTAGSRTRRQRLLRKTVWRSVIHWPAGAPRSVHNSTASLFRGLDRILEDGARIPIETPRIQAIVARRYQRTHEGNVRDPPVRADDHARVARQQSQISNADSEDTDRSQKVSLCGPMSVTCSPGGEFL